MNDLWDLNGDAVVKGDCSRECCPISEKTFKDISGYTHFIFKRMMFNNPKYVIPNDEQELFKKFLDGGSRNYPSDGEIPLDLVATEAEIIINKIIEINNNPDHLYYKEAKELVENGKYSMVRGAVKLYLGKFTTRDWRRKRYTDDIDFWIYEVPLFEHLLKNSGWIKNKITKEWEKQVEWIDYNSRERITRTLIASNDLNLLIDFGGGSYIKGANLYDVFEKKIKRGHDVDLSDIINVAMVNYTKNANVNEEWDKAWNAIVEATNTRDKRITSNLISLCRYSLAIADYIDRVRNSIEKYKDLIYDKSEYPNDKLEWLCRYSTHWMGYFHNNGAEATRNMIYSYLIEQQNIKREHNQNLKNFVREVLELLNAKYQYVKISFKIV